MKTKTSPSIPVTREVRSKLGLPDERFDNRGRLRIETPRDARDLAARIASMGEGLPPSAGDIYGAAWIISAWRLMLDVFGDGPDPFEPGSVSALEEALGADGRDTALIHMAATLPDDSVWHGRRTPREAALREAQERTDRRRLSGRERTLRNWTVSRLASEDPAFAPFGLLFSDSSLEGRDEILVARNTLEAHDVECPDREPENAPPLATLRKPVEAAPNSVKDQLLYILTRWGSVLGDWASGLVSALDMIEEETRPRFGGGPGPVQRPGFDDLDGTARFSDDHDWMPNVVMVAKNVLVWLDQLSRAYNRPIRTLDAIPDQELDVLASRGFNALWLIGLWERSATSQEIKRRMGNPEAAASAYSLFGYDIDPELGGWEALGQLRDRARDRGIRLSSDMVPNHVGIDSDWVRQHPDYLLSTDECPYPAYSFDSDNLSGDGGVDIRLEDHYWDKSDAAVVFKRTDRNSGKTKFVYHGNDGTSMPWNDTAQIDFLNAEAREAVIRDILHVARNFPIIRFDAAMVLARKSIRRLWYPAPGSGGAIPSRSEHALDDAAFDEACPSEFWRDVVDRVAEEIPGTLLLAEAFWMMEGYFVRALGMHRVYNSAFMNMLRDQKNEEYREIIKETLSFDPGILQRFVNFMNNPDEETAVDQFGKDDRYFASCTLLTTLPGLPMFGHGQVEGLSEKYGMEYVKAYKDEQPDTELVQRHEREIFPLVHRRALFASAASFRLFDLCSENLVNENVYAFTNGDSRDRALIVVNNNYEKASGSLHRSSPVKTASGEILEETLFEVLTPDTVRACDWVFLKEHISGLWYLRSTERLKDEGFRIDADGFGRQLYLDFRYEKEQADGIWGRLAAELGGTGVPDPDDAAAEIRLRPLKEALDAIISPDLLRSLSESIRQGRQPKWPGKGPEIAALDDARRKVMGSGDAGDVTSVENLIRLRLREASRNYSFFGKGVVRKLNRLFPGSSLRKDAEYLALRSILLSLLNLDTGRATAVWSSWGLDRWIGGTAFLQDSGYCRTCLKADAAAGDWMNKSPETGKALERLMALPEVREACGVNSWDGVLWYGEAEWLQCIRGLALSSASEPLPFFRRLRRSRKLRSLLLRWRNAASRSEYRLDRLLEGAR